MINSPVIFRRPAQKLAKLDFIVLGAQKAGTTALHYFLEKHPGITMSDDQELHFFDNDELFASGIDYKLLHGKFSTTSRTVITGENTPTYLYWNPAIERIWNYNSEIKLIVLLRNPVLRAFSHWNMQRDRKLESLDFLDALKAEPLRIAEVHPLQSRKFSYLDRGFYSKQLARVYRYFPQSQVKVVKYETFRDQQKETLASIFLFLGVRPLPSFRFKERNKIGYGRQITTDEYRAVAEIYRDEITKLEQLLGWDCPDWRARSGS